MEGATVAAEMPSSFADFGDRFHTVTVCPANNSRPTTAVPIFPSPRNAIFMGMYRLAPRTKKVWMVELVGIEPTTSPLRTARSPKLSYSPTWPTVVYQ